MKKNTILKISLVIFVPIISILCEPNFRRSEIENQEKDAGDIRSILLNKLAPKNHDAVNDWTSQNSYYGIRNPRERKINRISLPVFSDVFQSNDIPESQETKMIETSQNLNNDVHEFNNFYSPSATNKLLNPSDILNQTSENNGNSFVFRRHTKTKMRSKGQSSKRDEWKGRNKGKRNELKKKRSSLKKKFNNPRVLHYIKNDSSSVETYNNTDYFDCCPSETVTIEKKVGKLCNNLAVDIHPDHQVFYARVCKPGIENKECLFPSKHAARKITSQCKQRYSYVAAVVKSYQTNEKYKHEFIHIEAGCSCVASMKRRKGGRKTVKP